MNEFEVVVRAVNCKLLCSFLRRFWTSLVLIAFLLQSDCSYKHKSEIISFFKGDIGHMLALRLSPSIAFKSQQGCSSKHVLSRCCQLMSVKASVLWGKAEPVFTLADFIFLIDMISISPLKEKRCTEAAMQMQKRALMGNLKKWWYSSLYLFSRENWITVR